MIYHLYSLRTLLIISFLLISSCQQDILEEVKVYSNDFSTSEIPNIQSKIGINEFYNEKVLGFFHNESFTLSLNDLPSHNMIRVTIDIYIHDSWNGNAIGSGGPDVWKMLVDDKEIVNTTFSNSVCEATFCLYQSYPENKIRQFEPKTGALLTDLPGLCQYAGINGWTTKYRISQLIPHNQSTLSVKCLDELVQEDILSARCDESWSVSKIEVSVLNVR